MKEDVGWSRPQVPINRTTNGRGPRRQTRVRESHGIGTHPSHTGEQQEEQALPMSFHVLFRELDSDREDTDSEDDTGKFQGDRIDNVFITVAPSAGIENIGTVRACTKKVLGQ